MIIQSLEFEGFRGALSKVTIDVPKGFLVVTGRNGSGKSTVCDGIEYAITGSLSKHERQGRREKPEDYDWWRSDKTDRVPAQRYVRLVIANESGETFDATWTNKGPIYDRMLLTSFLCKPTLSPKDALQYLINTAIIRDEFVTRYSLDESPTDRFENFRKAVGTYDFSLVEEKISRSRNELRQRIESLNQNYTRAQARVENLVTKLSDVKKRLATQNTALSIIDEVNRRFSRDGANVQETRDWLLQKQDELQILHRLLKKTAANRAEVKQIEGDPVVKDVERHNNEFDKRILEIDAALKRLQEAAMEQEKLVNRPMSENPLGRQLASLLDIGAQLGTHDGRCYLCGSEISKDEYERHIHELRAGLSSQAKEASERLAALSKVQSDLNALHTERSTLLEKKNANLSRYAWYVERQNELTSNISELKKYKQFGTDWQIESLDNEIEKCGRDISAMEDWIRTLGYLIGAENLEVVTGDLKKAEEEQTAARSKLEFAKELSEQLLAASQAIRRISGRIVTDRVEQIKPLLKELYSRLRPHAEYTDFETMITGDVQHAIEFEVSGGLHPGYMYSSGQRRVVGLALLMGLNIARVWSNLRVQILDDPVQHIDDFRSLHLVETLASMRKAGYQIVCTVEDPALADLLGRRLRGASAYDGRVIELDYIPGHGIKIVRQVDLPAWPSDVLAAAG